MPCQSVHIGNLAFMSVISSQITFCLGAIMAVSASFWFNVQPLDGRNAVYATAVLMGSGGSVMLITSLSMIAQLIGQDKVKGSKTEYELRMHSCHVVTSRTCDPQAKKKKEERNTATITTPRFHTDLDQLDQLRMIGTNVLCVFSRQKSGAFVYGAIGFFDKVISGIVIAIIQECNPRSEQS